MENTDAGSGTKPVKIGEDATKERELTEDPNAQHRNEVAGSDADYEPDLARDPNVFSDEELGPEED